MTWLTPHSRDLWRFRAPLSAGEIRRTERWLATARVSLTIAALVTLWMEPTGTMVFARGLFWLLTVYLIHGVVVMVLVRYRHESTRAFRRVVHSADTIWPVLMASFTTAQAGPFFLFFVFVIAAAAYRWGLWETVGTAISEVVLLWLGHFVVAQGIADSANQYLRMAHLPRLGIRDLNTQQLFLTSVYLMIAGLLMGYMSENQKKLRAERAVITRVLGSTRVEAGLSATLEQILGEILNIYGARKVISASQEASSYRVFLVEMTKNAEGNSSLRWHEALPDTEKAYLFESAVDAFYAVKNRSAFRTVVLDHSGIRLKDPDTSFLSTLAEVEKFETLASVGFVFGREWAGRVFLLDPEIMGDREEELRFLQEFSQQVGPAIYNVYLMRRLRERAGAVERARFARELHDGAIQSLIAVEMQLDVVRRQSGHSPVVVGELSRIQKLLKEEVLKLRELMQEMKSFEIDAERLLGFLSDTVERFRRETGISAEFISELQQVELPQKVCRELARIVQESLVNVRKHSGAHNVLVRLANRSGSLQLTVEDDGRGFQFSGRLTQGELDGKGPVVIRDRVRLLAGELTVESTPGHGARLEVRIPPARQANNG